jgi:hypothetical protein
MGYDLKPIATHRADANPTAFLTLVGKIIPLQVTGKDCGPIQYQGIDAPAKETREEWLARRQSTGGARRQDISEGRAQ